MTLRLRTVRDTNVLSFVEAKWGRLAVLRVVHYYTDDVGLPWASPSLVMGWIKRPLGDRQPLGRSLQPTEWLRVWPPWSRPLFLPVWRLKAMQDLLDAGGTGGSYRKEKKINWRL
jgi:hypothetical protein